MAIPRRLQAAFLAALCTLLLASPRADAGTMARCGQGFLEDIDGYRVLHLKGTPYEMGYQHGALLRDDVREGQRFLFDVKAKEAKLKLLGLEIPPKIIIAQIVAIQRRHMPARFIEEMEGLAAGAGCDPRDVMIANFIPELFHCSGFAVMNSTTRDGTLYHGRILDYSTDWRLQEHAVLVIAEPDGGIPFVNVTYAGFVGSVTGMNAEHVSIGEMGGRGAGHWDGEPMAFLVRRVLEEAHDLDEALAVFRDSKRTCEYYYVIADGKTNRAAGVAARWNHFETVEPGQAHPLLPEAIEDAVVLSAGERYTELVRRVRAQKGTIDAEAALRLMDRPVAMKSNLHCVLFEPASTRFWVANASRAGAPAASQRYFPFQLRELLGHEPDTQAPVIALEPPPAAATPPAP
jgi:isopenicillin-N N-acyltransferase-like protein